ncbi:hypothetical protein, partial [Streptomyces leeuwenhoekii]|uniref:hypothetical protein n=1 Tax=Streptomyces leeuwenhoekii TaxID=1437453 RepID=UPI001F27B6C7
MAGNDASELADKSGLYRRWNNLNRPNIWPSIQWTREGETALRAQKVQLGVAQNEQKLLFSQIALDRPELLPEALAFAPTFQMRLIICVVVMQAACVPRSAVHTGEDKNEQTRYRCSRYRRDGSFRA